MNWRDIINRAVWTFVQAAVGVVATAATAGKPLERTLFFAAASAGLAAAVSVVKNVVVQRRS